MGIFQSTPDGRVTYANHAWYKMWGCPLDGDPNDWAAYVEEETRPEHVAQWQAFINDTSQHHYERSGILVSGRWCRLYTGLADDKSRSAW